MNTLKSNSSKFFVVIVFCFVFMQLFSCRNNEQQSSKEWPQWRGPMRDGYITETNLLKTWPAEGPQLLWSSDTIGNGYGSAIIQEKIIYVPGTRDSSEIITAFDLRGKLMWQKVYGKARNDNPGWMAQPCTPTFYKNKIYAFTAAGEIACINSGTGAVDWTVNLPEKFEGAFGSSGNVFCESPLVADDKIILTPCAKNTTIIALNSSTGETIWESESVADTGTYVSPVLIQGQGKKLIVTSTKKFYLAVDLNTGKIVWKERGTSTYVPLPGEKQVYFSGFNDGGKMLKINENMNSFSFKWSDSLKIKVFGGTVKLGNRIYGTYDTGAGLFSLDWETGKQLAINNGIRGSNLLAADGMIYSYEENRGCVSLLKPTENNIEIVGSFKVNQGEGAHLAHMSIGNGILFIRHGNVLMAYDIKQK